MTEATDHGTSCSCGSRARTGRLPCSSRRAPHALRRQSLLRSRGISIRRASRRRNSRMEVLRQQKTTLPFADKRDFEEQKKGFIAPMKDLKIMADAGHVAWDMERFQIPEHRQGIRQHPPLAAPPVRVEHELRALRGDSRHLSGARLRPRRHLLRPRQDRLDRHRPVDEPRNRSRAAWKLFQEHVGEGLPVSAVIYSHSHGDHWGGVRGIVDEADVRSGKVAVIAPRNFMQETISENVYAGNAMNRRLFYQYGLLLPASPYGYVGQGLGQGVSAGATGLIAPNRIVEKDIEEFDVDGVRMVFQNTPNTEAPSNMNTYIPDMKALWMAENVTATLHNIYTLRGAPVRDPLNWSKYISEALYRFGLEAQVMFASHHWPRWGNERIQEVLRGQRDLYANMNNQVLHLANQGVTINEIHNVYEVPKSLQQQVVQPRLPRLSAAQQPWRHPTLPRVLGRQSGDAHSVVAERFRPPLRGDDGRRREDHGPRPEAARPGEVPPRPGDPEQAGAGRAAEPEGQGSAGRRLRADRLPAGESRPAQQLPRRRLRAPERNSAGRSRQFEQPRRDPRHVHGAVPQLPRHSHGQPEGRGHALHDQPGHAGQRREVPDRDGECHADEHRRLPGRRIPP